MKTGFISVLVLICGLGLVAPAGAVVDINTATISELQTLPRIGPGLAQAIIDYREVNGPFLSTRDIMDVPRIGDSIYEEIKDLITVDGAIAGGAMDVSGRTPGDPGGMGSEGSMMTPIVRPTPTPEPTLEEVMGHFEHEPSIREVQHAAIRYAEINPAQFAEWRRNVRGRGLWPELLQFTVGHDTDDDEGYSRSKTIGISGGTAYLGPDDEAWDWDTDNDWDYEVRMRWNLQDYCFHNDALKISSETEKQVELRQEILENITKLYFDRRRLQVETVLQPNVPIALKVKRQLQLEEFTAAIDAMTGGFFSDALKRTTP